MIKKTSVVSRVPQRLAAGMVSRTPPNIDNRNLYSP